MKSPNGQVIGEAVRSYEDLSSAKRNVMTVKDILTGTIQTVYEESDVLAEVYPDGLDIKGR